MAKFYELCKKCLVWDLLAILPHLSFGELLCLTPEIWYDYKMWVHPWDGHRADQQDCTRRKTGWGWASPIDPCDPRSCFLWSSQGFIIWLSFHFCALTQYLSINPPFLLKLAKGNFCCSQPNRNLSCKWSRGRSGTSHGYTTNFFSLFPSLWMSAVQEIIVAKGRMFLPRDPIMASLIWREDCLRLSCSQLTDKREVTRSRELSEPGGTSFY